MSLMHMARGNTQESDEGDGNSWADFVPLEESFTGTFFSQSFLSIFVNHTTMLEG
jgi:hypothetical protein